VEERERRIGMNEALFREVNERLQELAAGFKRTDKLDLICECGNASCASRIEMDREEYEQVRSDSTTFAVVKGHEIPEVEEIVERRKAYDVVRKSASEAKRVAEKTDPRT
jgi:vacuolar-type H+-ATPase subunit I/STV1